jgi:hypothetical protein
MGYIGSLGDELIRAMSKIGLGPKVRLQSIADDAVREHGIGQSAVSAVSAAIEDDPALLVEMIDAIKFREPLIRRYLEGRAAALRALGAHVPVGLHKTGALSPHAHRDTETARVTAQQNPATRGHRCRDAQTLIASRSPGHAKHGLKAIASVQTTVRRGLLDTILVNGQKLRDVRVEEALTWAETMQSRAIVVGRICNGLDPRKPVGEQLTDEEAERRAAA